MSYKEIYYPESKFGHFTDVDGTITFYTRVNALIKPSFTLLDYGCGRGAYQEDYVKIRKDLRIFKNKVKKVIGIDIDEKAIANPFIDEFHLIDNGHWPMDTNTVDICICDFVLEHLAYPKLFFMEAQRVIKPNGYLCIRTTNFWGYVGLISYLVPNKYHAKFTSKVQYRRMEEDVFPALYKCNSISKIKTLLNENKFDCIVYGFEAEPAYLEFSKMFYWIGVLYQKFAPNYFRSVIFAFGRLRS